MFASVDFTYDGKKASTYGLRLVRMSPSFFIEDTIAGSASLESTELPFDFKTHLYKVKREPLEFQLQMALVDRNGDPYEWKPERRRNVFNWIFKNSFKQLIFEDEPEICYYAMASSELVFFSNEGKGYLEVTMKTNSPYAWVLPQKVSIKGNATSSVTATGKLSLAGKPKPIFDRIYPKLTFTRIPGGTNTPTLIISTQPEKDLLIIRLETLNTGSLLNPGGPINKVVIDGETNTVWEVDKNLNRIQSLYPYRTMSRGDRFSYMTYSHSGTVKLGAGWDVDIEYQYPTIR